MRRSLTGAVWTAGILSVVLLAVDWLAALLFDRQPILGAVGSVGVAVGITVVVFVARRVTQRVALPQTKDRKALRAAVEEEMALAAERPTELERLELVATRAWGNDGVLIVDCGPDGVVCLRGDPVGVLLCSEGGGGRSTGTRLSLEVLRWTQSVVSAASRGQTLPVRTLPADVESELPESPECQVLAPTELPPSLAALVGAPTAYR